MKNSIMTIKLVVSIVLECFQILLDAKILRFFNTQMCLCSDQSGYYLFQAIIFFQAFNILYDRYAIDKALNSDKNH